MSPLHHHRDQPPPASGRRACVSNLDSSSSHGFDAIRRALADRHPCRAACRDRCLGGGPATYLGLGVADFPTCSPSPAPAARRCGDGRGSQQHVTGSPGASDLRHTPACAKSSDGRGAGRMGGLRRRTWPTLPSPRATLGYLVPTSGEAQGVHAVLASRVVEHAKPGWRRRLRGLCPDLGVLAKLGLVDLRRRPPGMWCLRTSQPGGLQCRTVMPAAHAGAYSSSSGSSQACLLPMSPSDGGISRQCAIAGAALDEEVGRLEDRRADLIVRLGAPTPAVSAESCRPPKAPLRPSQLAS